MQKATPKEVSVRYQRSEGQESITIPVSYEIEKTGNIKQITCTVGNTKDDLDQWLQLRRFALRAMLENGRYTMLYEEENHSANLDTSLFIDQVCADILRREKMVLETA